MALLGISRVSVRVNTLLYTVPTYSHMSEIFCVLTNTFSFQAAVFSRLPQIPRVHDMHSDVYGYGLYDPEYNGFNNPNVMVYYCSDCVWTSSVPSSWFDGRYVENWDPFNSLVPVSLLKKTSVPYPSHAKGKKAEVIYHRNQRWNNQSHLEEPTAEKGSTKSKSYQKIHRGR